MKQSITLIFAYVFLVSLTVAAVQVAKTDHQAKVEQALKDDVPKVLCVNDQVTTAAQPKDTAYEKLAANGFRAVLNLRTDKEGVDLAHERELVEKAKMKYINIPVNGSDPKKEQVDEFLKVVKDKANYPLLIHCASANRVGAFWMIYRVVEFDWSEEKALEEATQVGLTSPVLKKFAQDYIANFKKQNGKPASS
jgi:uncharacterized protein (TIGR01244 family)